MNGPSNREAAIFNAVRKLPAEQRAAYLEEVCGGDTALRQQVEELLQANEAAGCFLQELATNSQQPTRPPGPLNPAPTLPISLAEPEKPRDRIGRYKLLQQIGEGGCGVVYMAEQEEPVRRRVALKVIKLGMDTRSVIARFEAERQALALMDHPNIAKVFDAGATVTGRPYFVMELVKGIPITRFCDENHLSTGVRLGLFVQVCQAIQHAHQKGIIHRDIKPSNILVTDHDGVPVPKIIDFGIAKATTDQRLTDKTLFTAFEQFIGTPAYMSPEQARLSGLDIDTRSDIYSLGVLLYELLTGRTPFEAKRLMEAGLDEIRRIIREEEPVRPSTRLHSLDAGEQTTVAKHRQSDPPRLEHLIRGDLDWIVMKCLEKDRRRRYETANGLAMDIQRHMQNEPVTASPPSDWYRFQKMARRNKVAFGVTGAVAGALLVGLGVSTWLFLKEKDSRRRAVTAEQAQTQLRQQAETAAGRAEAAALEAKSALSTSDFLEAVHLVSEDRPGDALAYLQRSLRANPDNEAAEVRLMTLLTYRLWAVPTVVLSHKSRVNVAQFSPDGRLVVTASRDRSARVWDAQTGQPLTEPLKHAGEVFSVLFSPDSKRVVTASDEGTAQVWDAQSGQPLGKPLKHGGAVWSAQFSPDGKRIVTASVDATARVWDAQTGEPLTDSLKHHEIVFSAEFSADGTRIVTASADGTARFWDAQTGQPLTGPLHHADDVRSAQFSPDGKRVVTASKDGTARVWDAQSGQPLTEPLRHGKDVNSAVFSPDGKRVVTASKDGTARVWDAQTGQPLTEPLRHGKDVTSAQFSPDGRRILTASQDGTAQVWDAQSGKPIIEPLKPGDTVWSAQFSPNGRQIVAALNDGTARVWDTEGGPPLAKPFLNHRPWVSSAQFSPDGKRISIGLSDGTVRVVDARSGLPLTEPLKLGGTKVYSIQFSQDGKRIVTASTDGTARVWDAQTGQPLTKPLPHRGHLASAQFSPDGKRIVTAPKDGIARVWDVQTSRLLTELSKHGGPVWSAQFSPDGRRILTASEDGTARVWDAETGQPLIEPLKHGDRMWSARFSPDGMLLVTASADGTAQVWDSQTGKPLTEPLKHSGQVLSAQFSRDGKRILTASEDGTARVWDAKTGQPLTEPLKHGGASAQFSPDGKLIVTGDETARVWDAQTGQPLCEPLEHGGPVLLAQFGPDGDRIVSIASGNLVHFWDVAPSQRQYPTWLLQLSEAISGRTLSNQGVIVPTTIDRRETLDQIRRHLSQGVDDTDWVEWGRWFLADPMTRTMTPFSTVSLLDYIEARIQQNTPSSLDEAEQLAAGNNEELRRVAAGRDSFNRTNRVAMLEYEAEATRAQGKGMETEAKYREIVAWYRKAADEGDAVAQCELGRKYDYGQGVAKDVTEALKWYRKAADQNYAIAQLTLARIYQRGEGVVKDVAEAEKWLRQAADQGDVGAMNDLAWLMATSDDPKLRDGVNAVTFAERAVAATDRGRPDYLDTLAASYAESGQYVKAVSTEREAIALLDDEATKNDFKSRLRAFESGSPYRQGP